jgi:hypothetical protein
VSCTALLLLFLKGRKGALGLGWLLGLLGLEWTTSPCVSFLSFFLFSSPIPFAKILIFDLDYNSNVNFLREKLRKFQHSFGQKIVPISLNAIEYIVFQVAEDVKLYRESFR